jgi:RNA polymerase sigma factor (sigma-70 family)
MTAYATSDREADIGAATGDLTINGQPPTDAAEQVLAGFRRPPADPARRVLPVHLRRPPAGPASQALHASIARRSAELPDHSSGSGSQYLPLKDVECDREVVASIVEGDPAGIAMAYDRYAAALYGYCHWMLHDSAEAAEALQDTFIVAIATMNDLPKASKLRPWLYAVARSECRRRPRTVSAARDEKAAAVSQPVGAKDGPAQVKDDLEQAELRAVTCSILAELKPREREIIGLSFRHDLDDSDLAIALGVSPNRVRALTSRTGARLEETLSALHIAFTRRQACPVLGRLLADWDGQLTGQTRHLVSRHLKECLTCANHGPGGLRPVTFSRLLPQAPVPPELREQVLSRCSSTAEDVQAYRRRVVRRAESTWLTRFSQAIRWSRWDSIRAHGGTAIAATAVAVWVVAAATVTLIFAAHLTAHAPRPSSTVSQPTHVPSAVQPSPSHSPKPSKSPTTSPKASALSSSPHLRWR